MLWRVTLHVLRKPFRRTAIAHARLLVPLGDVAPEPIGGMLGLSKLTRAGRRRGGPELSERWPSTRQALPPMARGDARTRSEA